MQITYSPEYLVWFGTSANFKGTRSIIVSCIFQGTCSDRENRRTLLQGPSTSQYTLRKSTDRGVAVFLFHSAPPLPYDFSYVLARPATCHLPHTIQFFPSFLFWSLVNCTVSQSEGETAPAFNLSVEINTTQPISTARFRHEQCGGVRP